MNAIKLRSISINPTFCYMPINSAEITRKKEVYRDFLINK